MGHSNPKCASAFCVLAPWFLGMVGLSSRVRISLRSRVFIAVANTDAR